MDEKQKNVIVNNVKEIPLSDILSEDSLSKQELLARLLSTIFVKYKVDGELQQVFRDSIKDISQAIAEDCFLYGYDNGYVAGHKDGKAVGHKEAKAKAEKQAAMQLQNKLEEELMRELLLNIAPGGRLQ